MSTTNIALLLSRTVCALHQRFRLSGAAAATFPQNTNSFSSVSDGGAPSNENVSKEDLDLRKMFEEWMIKHSRVYSTPESKEYRFGIFKRTVEYVNYHNARSGNSPDRCVLGINQFADLTYEEVPKGLENPFSPPLYRPPVF